MGRCAGAGPAFGVDVAMCLPLRFSDRGGVLGGHKLGPDAPPVIGTKVAAGDVAISCQLDGRTVFWRDITGSVEPVPNVLLFHANGRCKSGLSV